MLGTNGILIQSFDFVLKGDNFKRRLSGLLFSPQLAGKIIRVIIRLDENLNEPNSQITSTTMTLKDN